MIIAGFDLATTSGVAVLNSGAFARADCIRPAGDADGEIFRGFRKWLYVYLLDNEIKHAAIEAPLISNLTRKGLDGIERPMASQRAYLRAYGFRAIALETCFRLSIPCIEVNQSTWRPAFLGAGYRVKRPAQNYYKKLAVQQCRLLKWDVPNMDAAEACGVVFWLAGHLKTARLTRPDDMFAGMQ